MYKHPKHGPLNSNGSRRYDSSFSQLADECSGRAKRWIDEAKTHERNVLDAKFGRGPLAKKKGF